MRSGGLEVKRLIRRLGWLLPVLLLLGSNDAHKQGLSTIVPGLSGTNGNDETLAFLYSLREFALTGTRPMARIWLDPYTGNDLTGDGSFFAPYRSLGQAKLVAGPYTHVTAKGKDRVFSPLTYTVAAPTTLPFARGETVTWDAAASSGTVLDFDPATNTLVIDWDTGTAPTQQETFVGSTSGASAASTVWWSGVGSYPSLVVTYTNATELVNFTDHPYANGDGPFRLRCSDTGGGGCSVPTGLTAETQNYWVCTIAANTWRIDATSAACGALVSFTTDGSVGDTQVFVPYLATIADDEIQNNCLQADELCQLWDSEDPKHPAVVDGNRFNVQGTVTIGQGQGAGGDKCGVFCAGSSQSPGLGWVGVQNWMVQNFGADHFSTGAETNYQKLVTLNVRSIDSRNGTESRSTVLGDSNSCFAQHQLGALVSINGEGRSRADSAQGVGACIAPTDTNKGIYIGQGTYETVNVAANSTPAVTITGGDIVFVGHHLTAPTNAVIHMFTPTATTRVQTARVLSRQVDTSGFSNNFYMGDGAGNQTTDFQFYETTLVGRGRALTIDPIGGITRILGRGLLIDNSDYWILTADATSITASLDIQNSYVDDDDAAGADAVEWGFTGIAGTPYATRALAAAAAPAWTLFTNGQDSGGAGVDGTGWATDTVHLRCQPSEECWDAYRTPYTINLTTIYGGDPDNSCIPAFVAGGRICSFTMTPTHVGGR